MSVTNRELIENIIVTYNNKDVKVKDIMFNIKRNDSVSSSILHINDFLQILNLVNMVQNKKYKNTIFGNPLVMVFC